MGKGEIKMEYGKGEIKMEYRQGILFIQNWKAVYFK